MDDSLQHAHQVVLPQACNQLQKASNGVQQCIDIRGAIDEWLDAASCILLYALLSIRWAQPAQLAVPWVTRQGMNVNQWLEQWRTLLTKLE